MPLSTLVAGLIFAFIIAVTWLLCIITIKTMMWCYDAYKWYKIKRDFNNQFYRKDK